MLTVYLLAALVVTLDLLAISRAVLRAHGVSTTLAWIFAVLALPIVGAAMYFFFAVPYVGPAVRRKRLATGRLRAEVKQQDALSRVSEEEFSLLRLAYGVTGLLPSRGNAVELLVRDERAFERIEEALRGAKRSIWAQYFIVRNDQTGTRFLELLAQKAREGLDVRLLYDGLGSRGLDVRTVSEAGVRAQVFFPLNPLGRRFSFNLRNHRKMVVVDGQLGFTGGMNVGDEYSGRSRRKGKQHFLDSHLALRGPSVGDLAQTFAEDWYFATGAELARPERPAPVPGQDSVVAIVPSGPDQEHNATGLIYFSGAVTARRRMWLTSPYFIPDEALIRGLHHAALRGADVRVLVPHKSDVPVATMAGRSYYSELCRSGVRIFEYLPSMLHGKTMVVDGVWGMVGSANFDIRSFHLNFEIGALVHDAAFAARLEAAFLELLERSREVTLESLAAHGLRRRLADGAARLFSPLL